MYSGLITIRNLFIRYWYRVNYIEWDTSHWMGHQIPAPINHYLAKKPPNRLRFFLFLSNIGCESSILALKMDTLSGRLWFPSQKYAFEKMVLILEFLFLREYFMNFHKRGFILKLECWRIKLMVPCFFTPFYLNLNHGFPTVPKMAIEWDTLIL